MWGIPLPGRTEVQLMSSVKENIIKIKVLAGVNILKNNWRSMNWRIIVSIGRVSEEEYYMSGSPAIIIVYGQLPPRSWSTTTVRCQHDKGSAIIITISQHDTESAILDPPLRTLIRDPQVIIHDVATAVALDLRTIRKRDSGEEVKSVTCIDWDMITIEKRKEKLEREAPSVLCPPTF